MLFGVPVEVNRFFSPVVRDCSRPIRRALAPMVLAFLLAPHYRRLKTIAGTVLGHRVHVGTISRRLVNRHWKTRDWYIGLFERQWRDMDRWEREVAKGRRRRWVITIDTTYHSTVGECMENLIVMSRRKDPRRRTTKQHAFVMGLILTDRGGRIPLPRRSYYTEAYCRSHGKRYRTQNQLAALMLKEVPVPSDVDVTVVFDSAFDANGIHKVCRNRGFREVFPLDPNRNLTVSADPDAEAAPLKKVVAWTRKWDREEFDDLELQFENEDHVFLRRRHIDNLRVKKTKRRYAIAARRASVSRLGSCLVVASYKENLQVELLPGQSDDWWSYHTAPVVHRKNKKKVPSRWHGKVLACTDPEATARMVIEWYELRWQVELFFRELKSRMQFGCYVLMKFEAVERYLDFLMMGFLLLERHRLDDMKAKGPPPSRAGEPWIHARVTDRLRNLETIISHYNVQYVQTAIETTTGRKRLLKALRQSPCQVA